MENTLRKKTFVHAIRLRQNVIAHLGSQSQQGIQFILPTHRACHILAITVSWKIIIVALQQWSMYFFVKNLFVLHDNIDQWVNTLSTIIIDNAQYYMHPVKNDKLTVHNKMAPLK